jgi:hypothetical protein
LAVSSVLTAWSAEHFGPRPTASALGAVAVAWALAWTWSTTSVRRATMIEGVRPQRGGVPLVERPPA